MQTLVGRRLCLFSTSDVARYYLAHVKVRVICSQEYNWSLSTRDYAIDAPLLPYDPLMVPNEARGFFRRGIKGEQERERDFRQHKIEHGNVVSVPMTCHPRLSKD
ncbi:hypothetical protein LshimejAT787_0603170 [Lyophyllum shimeji]|uniref:Uncharacterized protein n=1 Tax=Lyophyllum shimeji TaxID=47721 RepID=A0A9P3PNJ9_LYOSH|nr:hypothetical protein LshimejAT787_0603170 [Lyophyllum shimeji]